MKIMCGTNEEWEGCGEERKKEERKEGNEVEVKDRKKDGDVDV